MGGDNMESLLLGGDDSSSGESDNEAAPSAPAAAVAPAAPPAAAAPAAPNPPVMSQQDMRERLKSMYSPAAKVHAMKPGLPAQQNQSQMPPQPSGPAGTSVPPPHRPQGSSMAPVTTGAPSIRSSGIPHQQVRHSVSQPPSAGPVIQKQVQPQPQQQQQPQPHRIPHQQISQQPPPQQTRTMGSSASGMMQHQQNPLIQQHQHQHRGSSGQTQTSRTGPVDPFEPTPVLPTQASSQTRAGVPHHASMSSSRPPTGSVGNMVPSTAMGSSRGVGIPHQSVPPSSSSNTRQAMNAGVSSGYTGVANTGSSVLPMSSSQQQQPQQPPSRMMASSTGATTAEEREREVKRRKEKFLIFTRVLMKYLEQKDPQLHVRVKAVIKECAERNKRGERGYESVTESMRLRLKSIVPENYWKRAEAYLEHFLKEKAKSGSSSSGMLLPGSSGGGGAAPATVSNATSTSQQHQDALKRKQQQMLMEQRKQQHAQQQKQHMQQARPPAQPSQPQPSVEPAKKRPSLKKTSSVPSSHQPPQQTSYPATSKVKGRSAITNKSLPSPQQRVKPTVAPIPETVPTPAPPPIVREYAEFMEQVSHAIDYDWTTAGTILSDQTFLTLSEEQKKLMDDSRPMISSLSVPPTMSDENVEGFPILGWSERNIVSSRVAWARLRLGRKQPMSKDSSSNGDVPLAMTPRSLDISTHSISSNGKVSSAVSSSELVTEVDSIWVNEERAEEDKALAALSEGTELYIKSVLEKALHCARQRQNLDGIRLWYQQHSQVRSSPPDLSLRLGCDVERQVALAEGNAAMICKRMEEALARQNNVPERERILNEETLSKALSMSDLALRPKLGKAVPDADLSGKRSFEVYGGKSSSEPPLGRIPKQAKLELVDFETGMNFARPRRFRNQAKSLSLTF